MSEFDTAFARAQFPNVCWDIAFFENAGGSFAPKSVIERMTAYMTESQVQPGAPFHPSDIAEERMNAGHGQMAAMLGLTKDEVVISPSTSLNVQTLTQAIRPWWPEGGRVIVSELNHEANAGPWYRLREFGFDVIPWPIDRKTAGLDMDALDELLTDDTRLVAFPHVSNITGDINDVPGITRKCHAAGALVCVDAVAYAPHRAIDVKAWDVDFYLFSFYKVFGPHIGCLYGKREHLLRAVNQYHYFVPDDDVHRKLNPAGPQHEMIASLAGVADYMEALASHHLANPANDPHGRVKQVFELAARHEAALARTFIDFLLSKPGVRLLGRNTSAAEDRCATFSFVKEGASSEHIATAAAADKVGIRHGDFYAPRVLNGANIADLNDGVVRCSMAHYNNADDVQRLIMALDKVL